MENSRKIIFHPNYNAAIEEIKKKRLSVERNPLLDKHRFANYPFPPDGYFDVLETKGKYTLNGNVGQSLKDNINVSGYDESKLEYYALEGDVYFTTHCIVHCIEGEYYPVCMIEVSFYTKSKLFADKSKYLRHVKDIANEANYDYVASRSSFIKDHVNDNTIFFIDGPIIGGNISSYTVALVKDLHERDIVPIFIVKNSSSNIVTDNMEEIRGNYHSDLHWSNRLLKRGERSAFFRYEDKRNKNFSKAFCYLKAYNRSPQRIEMHIDTYSRIEKRINKIMDLVYYLMLVQGQPSNPQIRPVAIAERYARETIKLVNSYEIFKKTGLTPTINQTRFGE